MKILELYQIYKQTYKISTDTRSLEKGSIFFALKGENFNANLFAEKALQLGAGYAVIDNKNYYKENENYILVKDVLQTLQDLANFHRKELAIPIISLTGSNGKTTTKELINVVLLQKFNVVGTKGNLNNHIGVPLTLLSMTPDTEIGIVEMGANNFGEIANLCEIVEPNYGYITNFGKAHLEGFGSINGVIKAKTELYRYLKRKGGRVFVNIADSVQFVKSAHQKRYLIGRNCTPKASPDFVQLIFDDVEVKTQLIGDYNYHNLTAAIGIGQYFKIPNQLIKKALENYIPNNKRSQLIQLKDTRIILDAYNANPTSMKAALASFHRNSVNNKMLILGDMFELGENVIEEHQKIVDFASNLNFNKIVLIGHNFYKTINKKAEKYKTYDDFKKAFNKTDYLNTHVLIKGSRGMELERIVELYN